jgi:predicted transcriptional regulator
MNKNVEYVKPEDHLEIALRIFTERSFQLLPVVKGKILVGCITRKEILSACLGECY